MYLVLIVKCHIGNDRIELNSLMNHHLYEHPRIACFSWDHYPGKAHILVNRAPNALFSSLGCHRHLFLFPCYIVIAHLQ